MQYQCAGIHVQYTVEPFYLRGFKFRNCSESRKFIPSKFSIDQIFGMSNYCVRYNFDSVAIARTCQNTLPLGATAVYKSAETQYDSSKGESDPACSDLKSEDNDEDQFFSRILKQLQWRHIGYIFIFISTVITIISRAMIISTKHQCLDKEQKQFQCTTVTSSLTYAISFFLLQSKQTGISYHLAVRSFEYLLAPVIPNEIEALRRRKREQTLDTFLGKWPTIFPSLSTLTA